MMQQFQDGKKLAIREKSDELASLLSLPADNDPARVFLASRLHALDLGSNAPSVDERALVKPLILGIRANLHPDFPYILAVEWYYDDNIKHLGQGDLVFSSFYFPPSEWAKIANDPNYAAPMKVLIVEAKHEKKHNKGLVGSQLDNSMAAWRKKRAQDEIWGAVVTQKNIANWWKDLRSFDDVKLTILQLEPVPSSMWQKKNRSRFPTKLWSALVAFHAKKSSSRCEICRWSDDKLVLHQRWTLGRSETLCFLGFELLCLQCHDVKHPGRAGLSGRDIKPHLAKVNNWSGEDAEIQIGMALGQWSVYNQVKINRITSELFDRHEVVVEWKEKHPSEVVEFGSLCCRFDHRV